MKRSKSSIELGVFAVIGFLVLTFGLLAAGLWIYGIYLAFSASVILGFLALILEPSPFLIGIIAVFGGSDLCEKLAKYLGL